jgi:hypothetical protein
MGRSKTIEELTNLLALSLRHKIGSIVNNEDIYSKKYADESKILLDNAKRNIFGITFNFYEKKEIANKLRIKLKKELEFKAFLKVEKFEIMEREMNLVLMELGLNEKD